MRSPHDWRRSLLLPPRPPPKTLPQRRRKPRSSRKFPVVRSSVRISRRESANFTRIRVTLQPVIGPRVFCLESLEFVAGRLTLESQADDLFPAFFPGNQRALANPQKPQVFGARSRAHVKVLIHLRTSPMGWACTREVQLGCHGAKCRDFRKLRESNAVFGTRSSTQESFVPGSGTVILTRAARGSSTGTALEVC